ncbi:MAG: metallophosphoesterase family protein [Planctomycetaceae bacterium]|nr:metallophosphoesterase family protein [Planctomycetaceae bacterium]
MKYLFLCCLSSALLVVVGLLPVAAQDVVIPRGQLLPDQIRWRPTADPDRIVLSWSADPSTSAAVAWRTDVSVKEAVGQIALAEDGPKFSDKAVSVMATTVPLETDLGTSHRHSVAFTGLKPDERYVYRVGDGANWSEWSQFRTAAAEPQPFQFAYFGDSQNSLKAYWSRVVREAYAEAPRAAFMIHAGDLINNAKKDAEWGEWFYASGFIHRSTPCIATPGNHEYTTQGGSKERSLTTQWRPTFALPENGPDGLKESCYWFDYQGARIISLNSNELFREQAAWLRTVLSNNPSQWTIVTCHHPLYSSKAGRDNEELRSTWQPVFDDFKVDLVLQGHDHTYARTGLMTAESNLETGQARQDSQAGTVYVVSVSGPKMYELGRRPFMKRVAEDTQLYQVIDIDDDRLTYRAFTATGRLYDQFQLQKGAPNRLIEQIPDTPENVRQ